MDAVEFEAQVDDGSRRRAIIDRIEESLHFGVRLKRCDEFEGDGVEHGFASFVGLIDNLAGHVELDTFLAPRAVAR